MTSIAASYAQIPPRSKFLRCIDGANIWTLADVTAGLANATAPYGKVGNLITSDTVAHLLSVYGSINSSLSPLIGGEILKDMGRELIFSLSNGLVVQKWTLVQRVKGITSQTEGVPDNYATSDLFYITTFNADADDSFDGVNVVRTG